METERIERLETKIDAIHSAITEIAARCPMMGRRVERIEAAIWGNGNVGLAVKINAIVWAIGAIAGVVGLVAARTISVWVAG